MEELSEEYGDSVEFMKVDGNKIYDVSHKYGIQSYPSFVYVEPNTKGLKAAMFRGNRSYDTMKSWMVRILKDVPSKSGGVASDEEDVDADYSGNGFEDQQQGGYQYQQPLPPPVADLQKSLTLQ